jgi:Amt family ammonium transporter
LALTIAIGYTFGVSYVLYGLTNLLVPLRVTQEEESAGLDLTQPGEPVGEVPDSRIPRPSSGQKTAQKLLGLTEAL